jgi:hypothetical protein
LRRELGRSSAGQQIRRFAPNDKDVIEMTVTLFAMTKK